MELYKIRYNLHNYIYKDNLDYTLTKEYIVLWKYFIVLFFALLSLVFIYKIRYIYLIDYLIIFIMALFVYIVYFEISIKIDEIENNIYLKKYGELYELSNIFFNEAYDFIPDVDIYNTSELTIKTIDDLLKNVSVTKTEPYYKESGYLYLNITDDDKNILNEFIRRNYLSYTLKLSDNKENVTIIIDDINDDYNLNLNNLFVSNTPENKYLINKRNNKYYIENNYLFMEINQFADEYYNFLQIIKRFNITFINDPIKGLIFTIVDLTEIDKENDYNAKATVNITDGSIVNTTIINQGSGYMEPPVIILNGGNGTGAILKANLKDYKISSINIINSGSGYTSEPIVIFKGRNIYDMYSIKEFNMPIYLKIPITNTNININNELNNKFLNYFFKKLVNIIENDKDAYKIFYKYNYNRIYLKIKLTEITAEKLKTNVYISRYIYQLIDVINKKNINPNNFIKYANDNSDGLLFNYLSEYNAIKSKIINNMKYEDNKVKEEIIDSHYYLTKKNNDLLKYIDIYNLKYLNKYCFVEDEHSLKEFKIASYTIDNKKYHMINVANLNNSIALKYINEKYETNFKNINVIYAKSNVKSEVKIKEIIDNFNYEYNKFIIILIILITIISHIFYIELIR